VEVAEVTVPEADTAGPAVSDINLAPNPNPAVPLAAILSLTTDEPSRVTLGFYDGNNSWTVTPRQEYATSHEIPVVGMKPGRVHSITATVTDEAGNSTETGAVIFETPALPEAFPRPHVIVHNPEKMEPGVTLFNINGRWGPSGKQEPPGFSPAVIVNSEGETLWYYLPSDHKVHDIKRLKNGNFIYEIWPGTGGMVEIDLLGNIVRRWHFTGTATDPAEGSIAVESDALHHDMIELPNGNLLVMSAEARVYDDWYTSTTDADAPRQSANLIGDVIIEMTTEGEIVRDWKLLDIIDPYRIGHGSMRTNFWSGHYKGVVDGDVYDWSHGNAIIYDETDNSFVMSMPYQNAVVKIDMDSGELRWILGTPDNWNEPWSEKLLTPVGDLEWSWKHHAISPTGRGTYLLFDNGVDRSSPFDEGMALADSYSRAVEYAVNEETMEVSQPWVYGPEQEQFYGRYLGDVDWQPTTGNVLINVGAQETDADGNNAPPSSAQRWARWIEVTSDAEPEKVWEMQFKDEGLGWSIYRAERIPGVYPSID
jgi:arylsulfate sulfotransferase